MSLLKVSEIKVDDLPSEKQSVSFADGSADNAFALLRHYERIEDVIGDLLPGRNIHFACMVEWSMHELLDYILQRTGPAVVYIATWSISEEGARYLTDLTEKGLITELHGLFDFRSTNRHPEAFHLAKQSVSRLRLYPCHAKVTLIINDKWQIAVNGSANYTNKKRIESGVISINNGVAEQHRDTWLNAMIEKGELFE
jgi:hypothetical protein